MVWSRNEPIKRGRVFRYKNCLAVCANIKKEFLTKVPFKPWGREDCAVNANRKDSTRLSKHVVVYFYIMFSLIKSERGMSCQGRKPTEFKTQPTLSSVIAKTRSRVLRSLCKYDSVWIVWSNLPDNPPRRMIWYCFTDCGSPVRFAEMFHLLESLRPLLSPAMLQHISSGR